MIFGVLLEFPEARHYFVSVTNQKAIVLLLSGQVKANGENLYQVKSVKDFEIKKFPYDPTRLFLLRNQRGK